MIITNQSLKPLSHGNANMAASMLRPYLISKDKISGGGAFSRVRIRPPQLSQEMIGK